MLAYDAAHLLARMFFLHGQTPVLECTYSRLQQRASLVEAMAEIPSAPLWIVEFSVSPDEAVQRWRRRNQPRDLNEQLVRKRAETFPYSDEALQLKSSSAVAPDDLARQIKEWLERQPISITRTAWAAAGNAWD
jgi:predicted kinase